MTDIVEPRRKPRTKLFELHEVVRLPVEMTDEARAFIDASSHNGRLLPQALSEAFGKVQGVEGVSLSLTQQDGATLLVVAVRRSGMSDELFHFDGASICYLPASRLPGMQAYLAAAELVRLFRNRNGG